MINPILILALSVGSLVQSVPVFPEIQAVQYLVEIEHRNKYEFWAHPIENKPQTRGEIALGLTVSSQKYDVPPMLTAAVTWKESQYRPDIISGETKGKLGEVGLGQLHGVLAKGCDMSTIAGQLDCTARGIRTCIDECDGTIEKGVNMYATGRCNVARYSKAGIIINARLELWRQLERIINGRQ